MTPIQQVREEFAEARRITKVSWSEREVLDCLLRAETIALLALGIKPETKQDCLNPNHER